MDKQCSLLAKEYVAKQVWWSVKKNGGGLVRRQSAGKALWFVPPKGPNLKNERELDLKENEKEKSFFFSKLSRKTRNTFRH